jgi:hypothetical protein
MHVRSRVLVLAAAVLLSAGSAGARPQTTAPPAVVNVKVTITDTSIGVTPKTAVRGAYVRFIVVNRGSRAHGFALGSSKPAAGVQPGFTKLLKPRERKVLMLLLDYRGEIAYRATLPADRMKPGMRGTFTIS